MSTACYNPSKMDFPLFGMPLEPSDPSARKVSKTFAAPPSPRPFVRDASLKRDRSEATDDDLINAAQSGDHQAFGELCRRYSPLAKKKILRIVRNEEDAEDAFQDTLLRAYTHLGTFRRSCKFSTWITAIGVNSALMLLRKRRVRKETYPLLGTSDSGAPEEREHVDPSLGPEAMLLRQQAILLVRREVQKLRPSLRSILDQYYGSENSVEELARTLGISPGAAKSRLLRGRVKLRSSLVRHGVWNSGT
jgi:RNA polymerase sigma-70 factor, ECF subfamily